MSIILPILVNLKIINVIYLLFFEALINLTIFTTSCKVSKGIYL